MFMSQIFNKSGGYRRLHSFNLATIVHLGTMSFCKRFIDWKDDPLGKTLGQMIGASRSGKQNIIEGSERAKTSAETEIKLTDVAKASLAELLGDLEDYLAGRGEIPWSIRAEAHQAISAIKLEPFVYTEDVLHDYWVYLHREKRKFDPWLEHQDAIVVANALIVLVQRTLALLGKQLQSQEAAFLESGGVREKMAAARLAARNAAVPECPQCGKPMRRRNSKKGEFWGCTAYPDCRGSRDIGDEAGQDSRPATCDPRGQAKPGRESPVAGPNQEETP
jgi:four helix bundle suffix protein